MIKVSKDRLKVAGTPAELLRDLTYAIYSIQKQFDEHNVGLNVFDEIKKAYDLTFNKADSVEEKEEERIEDMFKELGSLIKELIDLQKLNKEGK